MFTLSDARCGHSVFVGTVRTWTSGANWIQDDEFHAAGFPSTSKSSVCWDPLQTLGAKRVLLILQNRTVSGLRTPQQALSARTHIQLPTQDVGREQVQSMHELAPRRGWLRFAPCALQYAVWTWTCPSSLPFVWSVLALPPVSVSFPSSYS